MEKLTFKQQRFVNEYLINGNATQSAIKAGYSKKSAEIQGFENLRKPKIAYYIDEQKRKESNSAIMSRQERQELWTEFTKDKNLRISDRLRASELLGKSEADFTENLKVEAEVKTLSEYIDDLDEN